MAGAHLAVAQYDPLALDLLGSLLSATTTRPPTCTCDARRRPDLERRTRATRRRRGGADRAARRRSAATGTPVPDHPAVGRQGAPQRPARRLRRAAGRAALQHRHDDRGLDRPGDQQVAMFQPAARHGRRPGAAGPRSSSGAPTTAARSTAVHARPQPAGPVARATTRRARVRGLKAMLGDLYGLDIRYYVAVNFEGFRKVVDALGGVNDQRPDPGRRRPLPGAPAARSPGSTSPPGRST